MSRQDPFTWLQTVDLEGFWGPYLGEGFGFPFPMQQAVK